MSQARRGKCVSDAWRDALAGSERIFVVMCIVTNGSHIRRDAVHVRIDFTNQQHEPLQPACFELRCSWRQSK
jgi:hypothetical protein